MVSIGHQFGNIIASVPWLIVIALLSGTKGHLCQQEMNCRAATSTVCEHWNWLQCHLLVMWGLHVFSGVQKCTQNCFTIIAKQQAHQS